MTLKDKIEKLLKREGVRSVYTEFGGDPSDDKEVYKRYCATTEFEPTSYAEEVFHTIDAAYVVRLEKIVKLVPELAEPLNIERQFLTMRGMLGDGPHHIVKALAALDAALEDK